MTDRAQPMAGTAPASRELAPAPSLVEVARAVSDRRHLLVLDSAEFHPERGRYSFAAFDPAEWHAGRFAELERAARGRPRTASLPGLPPFQGGYAGLFGYGVAAEWEPTPLPPAGEFPAPGLAVGYYDTLVAFDHLQRRAWLVAPPRKLDAEFARLAAGLARNSPCPVAPFAPAWRNLAGHPVPGRPGVVSNFARPDFEAAVARAVEYVRAGDCFQVNLAQRLMTPLAEHPLALWERLRAVSPAPFGGYFDLGDVQLVSASPERFIRGTPSGELSTRPIKGTRPRRADPSEDDAMRRELLGSAKDRAENVMIVDLLRNDLGRVAQLGSVRVPAVCELESFRHVHHLVSEVRARLAPRRDWPDVLRAALPGGSVTGAPKVRSMEIIAELEGVPRGAYCGTLGYFADSGAFDTNIVIRTFTCGGGVAQFPVGGGVVADSVPECEYRETLDKAAGLLRALAE